MCIALDGQIVAKKQRGALIYRMAINVLIIYKYSNHYLMVVKYFM